MDRHFDVPVDPARLSDSVHIRSFDVEPYPDGRRLKCTIQITDSSTSPDAEIIIEDHEGHTVASSNIIGLSNSTAKFTVHIREPTQANCYTAKVSLIHHDVGLVDQRMTHFSIPPAKKDARG
jgi:hypothetical protein